MGHGCRGIPRGRRTGRVLCAQHPAASKTPSALNRVPCCAHTAQCQVSAALEDSEVVMERVEVWRGHHGDPAPPFGPLPGVRLGDALAYEFEPPARFVPWPGRTLLERVFVLLDLGVSMSIPSWQSVLAADGDRRGGMDAGESEPTTWYVDLVHVTTDRDTIVVRDLYVDVMVPTDGRHQRRHPDGQARPAAPAIHRTRRQSPLPGSPPACCSIWSSATVPAEAARFSPARTAAR